MIKTGMVKWFSQAKGYGFITPGEGEADVFVHYSGIDGHGYRNLLADQKVEFEMVAGAKGQQAINVRIVG